MPDVKFAIYRNYPNTGPGEVLAQSAHSERAEIIHKTVEALNLEVRDWGETDSSIPHEVVEVIVALATAGVFTAVANMFKVWLEREKISEVTIDINGKILTLKDATAQDAVLISPEVWGIDLSEKISTFDLDNSTIDSGGTTTGENIDRSTVTNIRTTTSTGPKQINELLSELNFAVENEFKSDKKHRQKALKQVKALKEAAENPNKKENKEKAENASLILKDLSAGAAIHSILNRIREILGLEAF